MMHLNVENHFKTTQVKRIQMSIFSESQHLSVNRKLARKKWLYLEYLSHCHLTSQMLMQYLLFFADAQ